jgi:hypothetical protein
MVYDIQDYWVFGLCPTSGIIKTQKNTTFRKLDLFPSSGVSCPLTLRRKQIQFPKRCILLCFYNTGRWTKSEHPIVLNGSEP